MLCIQLLITPDALAQAYPLYSYTWKGNVGLRVSHGVTRLIGMEHRMTEWLRQRLSVWRERFYKVSHWVHGQISVLCKRFYNASHVEQSRLLSAYYARSLFHFISSFRCH
jgi:hypothetical protein